MKKPPRTELRGGRWWYRRRVPTELVQVLGFSEYRESLHTSDIQEARVKASIRDAEVTVELQAAKAQHKKLKAAAKPPERLSPQALEHIREAVKAHTLRVDEEFRRSGPDEDSRSAWGSIMAEHLEESGRSLLLGKAYSSSEERRRVEEALQAVGVTTLPDEWDEAALKASEGYNLALQAIRSRESGDYIPTPSVSQNVAQNGATPVPVVSPTLGEVMGKYLSGVKQSGYTRKVKRCLQLFGEVIGKESHHEMA